MNLLEGRGSKPDFIDLDKDGDRKESMKKAADDKKKSVKEGEHSQDAMRLNPDFKKVGAKPGIADKIRAGAKRVADIVAPDDEELIRRLEKSSGGKRPMDEADMEEGNRFTGNLMKARAAGKKQADLDGDGDMEPVRENNDDRIDEREFYSRGDFDDRAQPGDTVKTTKGVLTKTKSGVRHERSADDSDDADDRDDDKPRGRGRPKGSTRSLGAKGPSGRSKLMQKGAIKEGDLEEDYDRDEYDEEGEMAKSQARVIVDAARELQEILDDDENLPEWVQKKITLAKEYIDSARDYMKANPDEEEVDVELVPEGEDGEFTQADWDKVARKKRHLMILNRNLGPEDAEQMAAEKLGYDYEDVLAWIESDQNLEEKAVSKAQRAAAGIAYAAKKGDVPKSELRGASKEMAKMASGELKKFAKTKEKDLPEKKKKEVDETTTAGSVATAPSSGKASGIFGKGVYEAKLAESFNKKLSSILSESLDVSVTAKADGSNTVTVTGNDVAPDVLMDLLKMAGMSGSRQEVYKPVGDMSGMLATLDGISGQEAVPEAEVCEMCGGHEGMHEAGCGGRTAVEEELANSADNTETMSTDYMVNQLAGGLNGPKMQVNPNNMADNPLAMRNLGSQGASGQLNLGAVAEDVETQLENRLLNLYKRIK
jgi:ribosomal protein L11